MQQKIQDSQACEETSKGVGWGKRMTYSVTRILTDDNALDPNTQNVRSKHTKG